MIRQRARLLSFGLQTLTGLRRRGFFIPYRYADQMPPAGQRVPYPALEARFRDAEPEFLRLLQLMSGYGAELTAIGAGKPPEPRWRQDWFPRLDGAATYTLVRDRKPRRIVEVGSGHSTRFMAKALRDGQVATELTAIDPSPRADLAGLPIRTIRTTVQEAGTEPFAALQAGDIVFIDSSHILMPGTDVDLLFNRILPGLPAGVLVHVHDVFLPDDYPAEWEWRGYNEQLGVSALISAGGYRPLWASHYVATRMRDAVAASAVGGIELVPGAFEASVWLEKTAG